MSVHGLKLQQLLGSRPHRLTVASSNYNKGRDDGDNNDPKQQVVSLERVFHDMPAYEPRDEFPRYARGLGLRFPSRLLFFELNPVGCHI